MKKRLQNELLRQARFACLAVVAFFVVGSANAQTRIVSGKITGGDTQEALPGATVQVQGTTVGTVSSADGNYRIEVPNGSETLVFSYLGYETQQVNIGGRSVIDMKMTLSVEILEDFVVVGYGIQRRSDLTGAVGSVEEEDFNAGVITSPGELIQGKLAGVTVTNANGEPGSDQTILIRGIATLRSGNDPLFVVDGVPLDGGNINADRANVGFGNGPSLNPLNFINPADIESIDVLKDASAAAIYGSRAANGVIIITTKKGKGGKAGLSYNNYFSWGTAAKEIDLLSTSDFIAYQDRIGESGNINDRNVSTDWQDEIFRTAFTQNHNVGFNGGGENSDLYVSMSLMEQEGIMLTNKMERYTGRINFSQRMIDDRLKFGVNLTAGHTVNGGVGKLDNADANFGSIIPDALGGNPTFPTANSDGSLFIFPIGRNPLAGFEILEQEARLDRILGNVEGSFEIIKGLEYKINFAIDRSVSNADILTNPSGLANIAIPEGQVAFTRTENNNRLIENFVSYTGDIDRHNFTVLLGHSYQRFFRRNASSSINGFSVEEINPIFAPQVGEILDISLNRPNGSANVNELQSFFGRVNYTFNDRYLFTGTLRADGSSRFGENNRYGLFPSLSAAWKLTEEAFLADNAVFSELKLRAGWGQTGNQEIPNKITQPALSSSNDERGGGYPLTTPIGNAGVNPGFTFQPNSES